WRARGDVAPARLPAADPRTLHGAEPDSGQSGHGLARIRCGSAAAPPHAGQAGDAGAALHMHAGDRPRAEAQGGVNVRVVVSGATGRMGRAIASLAADAEDVRLVGGLYRG